MNAPDLFGAFANPTRLRILNLLQEAKEICVCDLCEVLGEPQP
jgi:ArsR family transcriptional regulator